MPWFEDMVVGEALELGAHHFTADEIVAFARRFDPQPFHMDEEAAKASQFGALCASGWHTAAVWMRLQVAHARARATERGINEPLDSLGPSPGFQDLKWVKPVYAGDTISYTTRLMEKRDLKSRPRWGLATSRNEGFNQMGALVFAFTGHVFVRRRLVA
jgi:acyl dehydratase